MVVFFSTLVCTSVFVTPDPVSTRCQDGIKSFEGNAFMKGDMKEDLGA